MVAIEARSLSFRYRGSSDWAIRDINLTVEQGEYVLITGPSGCGKTTLCRCFNGLIPHFYEGDYEGDVILFGEVRVRERQPYELASIVGMVFQDPESQLIMSTVEREIAFGLENLALPRDEIAERIEWALDLLGIRHLRDRAPYELSGGEQQKVAIAAVLAMRPRILVLDEPTANLDPWSSKELIDLLDKIRDELDITMVIVEHRLELLAERVDRVVVMDRGRVIADGKPEEVLARDDVMAVGIEIPRSIRVYKELFRDRHQGRVPLNARQLVEVILHAKGEHRDKGRGPVVQVP